MRQLEWSDIALTLNPYSKDLWPNMSPNLTTELLPSPKKILFYKTGINIYVGHGLSWDSCSTLIIRFHRVQIHVQLHGRWWHMILSHVINIPLVSSIHCVTFPRDSSFVKWWGTVQNWTAYFYSCYKTGLFSEKISSRRQMDRMCWNNWSLV